MLRSERAYYRWLTAIVGLVALLKGIHFPDLWTFDQAQFDYRFGFLKRGLLGEIFRLAGVPVYRYPVFVGISLLWLAILFAVIFWALRRSGLGQGAIPALIAGSMCVTYSAMLVGYYDIVLTVLVALILVANPRTQPALALLLGILGVLIHEVYAIAFLPVSLVGLACRTTRSKRWLSLIFLGLTVALFGLYIMRMPPLPIDRVRDIESSISSRTGMPWDARLSMVFTNSADSGWTMMRPQLTSGHWWGTELFALCAFLPTTLFFLALAERLATPYGKAVRCYLVVAVFAPMILNFIALDRMRWLSMMEMNSVLCAIGVAWCRMQDTKEIPIFSILWQRAAMLLLVANLATGVGLIGGRVKTFPFEHAWSSIQDLMR